MKRSKAAIGEKVWWLFWFWYFTFNTIQQLREGHDLWASICLVAAVVALLNMTADD